MVSSKLPLSSLGKRLVKCLESAGIAVQALYLFGSHARGRAKLSSDIDIVLVSPTFASTRFWTRCARVGEAIAELPEPVQVYPVTVEEFDQPEPGGFIESIRQDLKPVYLGRPLRTARISRRSKKAISR